MRTLKRTLQGNDVKIWQAFLIEQGHLEAGGADSMFGPKTHAATKAFQEKQQLEDDGIVGPNTLAKAVELGFLPPDEPTSLLGATSLQRLDAVHPELARRVKELVNLLGQRNPPIRCLVNSGFRSFAEQQVLFNQGRTTPGPIVTQAEPGESYHNYGLAIDLVSLIPNTDNPDWRDNSPNWSIIGGLRTTVRLEWGGVWTSFVDRPHWQLTTGLTTAQCLELHKAGGKATVWNKINQRLALESSGDIQLGEEVE